MILDKSNKASRSVGQFFHVWKMRNEIGLMNLLGL